MNRVAILAILAILPFGALARRVNFSNDRTEADVLVRELPAQWDNLVEGGQFIDRFHPMPDGTTIDNPWGREGVRSRFVDNGIESDIYSFWGGNIIKDKEGLYHLFVCGWKEDNPRGHRMWGRSLLFHTTCDNSIGPYHIIDTIGYGHNVDTFQISDGSYVSYNISRARGGRTFGYYHSPTLYGEWEYNELEFIARDRTINVMSNFSFTQRADGSVLAVGKDGRLWISRDGLNPYMLLTDYSVYPDREGFMEDPEIWRDNVQYNMVVNDAHGRVAYYGRSRNGYNWIWEDGLAYTPGKLSVHKDGTVEDWHKYERVKILQDDMGRAIQANFAVMDMDKILDKGGDNHSAKNISIPMNAGVILEWVKGDAKRIANSRPTIRIKAEEGFDPSQSVDIESLRLGNYNEVSYGGGSPVVSSKVEGKDLIVTFERGEHHLAEDDFAAKLLGRDRSGELIYGYVRLPWAKYDEAILSPLAPVAEGNRLSVRVDNLGVAKSQPSEVVISVDGKRIGSAPLPEIEPYKDYTATIVCTEIPTHCCVEVYCNGERISDFDTPIK
ncbi:MAG: glycoside hydrolase family protein [Rikenellaceae bacterium]